jgi:predicted MFS family arabinose efflux permease
MSGLHGVNGWAGWQWVLLLEGVPSVIAGIVTFFYLTDQPQEARWLTPRERELVMEDMERDRQSLGHREHGLLAALKSSRIWLLIAIYFCIVAANSSLTFYGPTLVKGAGFASPVAVGWIMAGAYLCGAAGMIWNGYHSDRQEESRYHCALAAALGAGSLLLVAAFLDQGAALVLSALTLAIVGTMSAIPVFWQMPSRFLAGTAAAGGVALINSIANLAGFGAPWTLGVIKDATGSLAPGLYIVAAVELGATLLILALLPAFGKRSIGGAALAH